MAKVSIFQRYSTVENTVTNNTLQLFARIYKYSPEQASKLLAELTEVEFEIGLEIRQQQRVGNAVPDGSLSQSSFRILIEAKVDATVEDDQLLRHCLVFSDESVQILLLLTRQHIAPERLRVITEKISKQSQKVVFKNITFEDICSACKGMFTEHEFEMNALVEDYWEYCNDAALFDQSGYLMRIVPCRVSIELNRRHQLYFDSSTHGYTKHRFVGVYSEKKVHFLIDIGGGGSVFDVSVVDGTLIKEHVEGTRTDKYDAAIRAMVDDAKRECGYDISKGHRFFCGNNAPTDFKKTSRGGIMGKRLMNLKEVIGPFVDVFDAADRLSCKSWE